jgi:DNA polymerase-1
VNFPIQGSAADILKKAMLRVADALRTDRAESRGQRARMILTVHDELLIESPEDIATDVAEAVRDAMQGATTLAVPLTVDVGIGPNWREAKS